VIRPCPAPWLRSLSSLAFITFVALAPQLRSQTFNGGAFSVPDSGVVQNQTVTASGVAGSITAVTVTLNFTSSFRPDDMEFLLVAPDGTSNLEFLSDGGGNSAIGATAITLSDGGATCVPDGAGWVSGTTYKPADYSAMETGTDFGLPALTINRAGSTCVGANGTTTFAVAFGGLSGTDVNGTWHLYARDDTGSGDAGAAVSSWSITITAQSATAIVGNFVFNDLNGNGIQDGGEPGIDGVTVRLLNSPGLSQVATTTTAGGGLYSFTGVTTPANYVIEFTAPAGFAFSPKDQGGNDNVDSDANTGTGQTDPFALAGGQTDNTRDCGMTGTYVGNFVFGDSNHNGVQDVGEIGIDGVTVQLLNSSDAPIAATTTAGGGLYRFLVIPAGTYSIKFTLPAGYTFSPQDQGGDDTKDSDANTATGQTTQFLVTNGVIDDTRDAGMFASGVGTFGFTSTGITINDTGGGVATPYPSTLSVGGLNGTVSKITITFTGFTDPRPDDVDMLLVGPTGASLIVWSDVGGTSGGTATITLDDVAASFLSDAGPLASGTFKPTNESTVQDAFPAPAPAGPYGNPGGVTNGAGPDSFASKYNNTNPNGTWSLYILDDATGAGGAGSITSWSLNVTTQATTAVIGDRVFEDQNNNGIQNAGEPGVDGITVRLLNSPALTTAATTTTSGGGLYQFTSVGPGDYVVQFVAPAGYSFSPKDQGGDDTIDSDANTGTGTRNTDQFSVVAGQIDSSRDAGLVGTFVGDKVFGDINHNGIQDGGDAGIDGVTVRLRNSSDAIVGTTTTAGGGLYRFLVTTPANYSVEFILPSGYAFSPQDQGGNDTLDSDADTSTGRTIQFAVLAGQPDSTHDAGMYATSLGPLTFQSGAVVLPDATTATPYPSTISIGGRTGTVTKVRVVINGFSDTRPDDVDMLLVGPTGASFIILSDVGGTSAGGPVTITLDDAAASFLSDGGALSTGTFKPTNESTAQDPFSAPAPAGPYGNPGGAVVGAGPDSFASKFNTTNPNGTWSLYILDDTGSADAGGSMTSWGLEITTSAAPPTAFSAGGPPPATATVGQAYAGYTFIADGSPSPTYALAPGSGPLPGGFSLSAAGVLSAANPTTAGVFSGIIVRATNSAGTLDTAAFTITVNQAPTITSANSTTFTVGTNGSFQLTASGFPASFTFSNTGTALPSGVTLSSSGLLSGIPDSGTGGVYILTFQVSNGVSPAGTQSFTLTVNQAPTITSANSTTFTVGTNGSFQLTASGFPASFTFTNTGTALPSGVTLSSSGLLSGIPDSGTGGVYILTFQVSNGVSPAGSQSFTLTVNQAPAITSANSTTFTVGTNGNFQLTASGFPASFTFTNTGTALPSGVTLSSSGLLSGIPDSGTDAVYSLTFQVSNGVSPAGTQSFTLTVDPAATPTCVPPPAGMISWWPGDGNANDIRGLNDGALQGTATFAAAKVGQGFSLNGTSDYVEIPNSSSVSVTGQITIDAWINPAVVTGQGRAILSKYDSGAGQFSYNFFINTDGTLIFAVYHGANPDFRLVKTSAALTANVFTHVAATFNPTTQATKIYVNGQDTNAALHPDSSSLPGVNATTTPVRIGTYKEGASLIAFFSGIIDEVEIFNRALCADDILAIYNAGSAGKCKPLLNVDFNSDNPGPGFSATQDGFIGIDVADATSSSLSLPLTGLDLATAPTGNATLTVQAPSTIASRDRAATPPNSGAFNFSDLYRDVLAVAGGPFTISLTGLAPNTIFDVTFYATDQAGSSSNTVTFANTTNGGSVPSGSITYGPPVASNHQFSVRLRVISNASGALTFSETSTGPQGGPVINGLQVAPVPTANACPSPTPAALQLLNIAGRASVGTGDNVAIGGFIIQNDAAGPVQQSSPPHLSGTTKRVLVRGLGPSLAVSGVPVPGRLLNPVLDVYDENGVLIASNDNWRVPSQNETDVQATGLAPSDNAEPALALTLDANASLNVYTAVLRGAGGTTGIGLIEIYDLEPNTTTHLVNISTRAQVLTGNDVLIGGIIVGGGNTQMLMIRALGPSLQVNGTPIAGRLADPYLELHDAQGTLIAHNDNWKEEPDGTPNATREAQIVASGLPPDNVKEAAILYVAPPPGIYTAIESGVGGTGIGLIEVYRLGPPPGP
jgi:subtilisin-like proprotein convertase family protein